MRLGYIRISKAGPSRIEQEAALIAAGVADFSEHGPVYMDVEKKRRLKSGDDQTPARTDAIRALRTGDDLAVHSPARLGATRANVLEALEGIGRAGAAVYDCASGEVITIHPDAAKAIGFAERAESQGQRERAAQARRGITRRAGPPPALEGKKLVLVRAAWVNPETTARMVADEFCVSVRTLYRRLGNKGTPVFGRKKT